jgi:hypothetical protein
MTRKPHRRAGAPEWLFGPSCALRRKLFTRPAVLEVAGSRAIACSCRSVSEAGDMLEIVPAGRSARSVNVAKK